MPDATARVQTHRTDEPPFDYGGPAELVNLLDGVAVVLRGEEQVQWTDPDLCAATEALADHLRFRLNGGRP